MKVLIVEDEQLAAERLSGQLNKYDPSIQILDQIASIKRGVQWFEKYTPPDLAFFDIQLADGLSFEIFEQARVDCPVIFTTAYDEYALRAFKVNSIDYLLKPLSFEELVLAIEKFKNTQYSSESTRYNTVLYDTVLHMMTKQYKQRFVIRVGEHIRLVPVENINYFFSQEKATFLSTKDNHNYVIDYSLEQIENLVDEKLFFRINRKYIINLSSIKDILSYSNSRLKVKLDNCDDNDVIVSRKKVNEFKMWLDR